MIDLSTSYPVSCLFGANFRLPAFVPTPRDSSRQIRCFYDTPGKNLEMSSTSMAKKNKAKKAADPNETSKLLAAKISQLEQDAAGEKDQEAEIGA